MASPMSAASSMGPYDTKSHRNLWIMSIATIASTEAASPSSPTNPKLLVEWSAPTGLPTRAPRGCHPSCSTYIGTTPTISEPRSAPRTAK